QISCHGLFCPPLFELVAKVVLEGLEPIAEQLTTAPALEISLEVTLLRRIPSHIVLVEREVVQQDEERSVEAVVVLPVSHLPGMHVPRQHMKVQVVHARI